MDYEEMESELETAGIDTFDFALMDEVERREALEDACLDPDDFEDFDLEYPGRFSYSPSYVPVPPAPPRETKAIGIGDLSGSHGRITEHDPPPAPPPPASAPTDTGPETCRLQQEQRAEAARIESTLKNLRRVIFILIILLGVILIAGISSGNRSSKKGTYTPVYTPRSTVRVTPRPTPTAKPTSTPRPSSIPKPRSTAKPKSTADPYQASDYAHPEDFYDWYYDDFWDYEDAEDYWEDHH